MSKCPAVCALRSGRAACDCLEYRAHSSAPDRWCRSAPIHHLLWRCLLDSRRGVVEQPMLPGLRMSAAAAACTYLRRWRVGVRGPSPKPDALVPAPRRCHYGSCRCDVAGCVVREAITSSSISNRSMCRPRGLASSSPAATER